MRHSDCLSGVSAVAISKFENDRCSRRRNATPAPAARVTAVANPDGSTTVYFAPTKPAGVNDGNWIQTDPTKGWNTLLRLYSPLEPFLTKEWRPTEIELVQ